MVPLVSFLAALRILTEAQICNNGEGKIAYEKIVGFSQLPQPPDPNQLGFNETGPPLHEMLTRNDLPLKVLEQCFQTCQQDKVSKLTSCSKFDFLPGKRRSFDSTSNDLIDTGIKGKTFQQIRTSYEPSRCIFYSDSNSTLDLAELKSDSGSIWHFNEVCLTAQTINRMCPNRPYVFERISSFRMVFDDGGKELDVHNLVECENACLTEKTFTCRSANYDRVKGKCYLTQTNRHVQPDKFQPDPDFEYMENVCLKHGEMCKWNVFIIESGKQLEPNYEKALIPSNSVSNCSNNCLESLDKFGFVCRSFVYDDEGQSCILYDEDPLEQSGVENNGNITNKHKLVPSRGNLYRVLCSTDEKDKELDNKTLECYRHKRLRGRHQIELPVSNFYECLSGCLHRFGRRCHSIEYSHQKQICRFSGHSVIGPLSDKDDEALIDDDTFDYYQFKWSDSVEAENRLVTNADQLLDRQDSIEVSNSQPGMYGNFIVPVEQTRDHHRAGFAYDQSDYHSKSTSQPTRHRFQPEPQQQYRPEIVSPKPYYRQPIIYQQKIDSNEGRTQISGSSYQANQIGQPLSPMSRIGGQPNTFGSSNIISGVKPIHVSERTGIDPQDPQSSNNIIGRQPSHPGIGIGQPNSIPRTPSVSINTGPMHSRFGSYGVPPYVSHSMNSHVVYPGSPPASSITTVSMKPIGPHMERQGHQAFGGNRADIGQPANGQNSISVCKFNGNNQEIQADVSKFRRVGFSSRMKSKHIYKVVRADRLEDCERYCLETKDFVCKSFNFRAFFPDNCELSSMDTKKFKVDNVEHFEHNTQFDYYERIERKGMALSNASPPNSIDCFEVLQTCSPEGMELKLKTQEGFYGRIYTYGFYDSCFFDGNGGTESSLRISKPNGFPRCGTQQVGDAMTNIVVVQFNDYVQTSRDRKYNLTCYISGPGEAVVTSNYLDTKTDGRHPMQIEHLPAQNILTANIGLRVLYRGTPTNTIVVGDLLTFRLEARNQYRYNGYHNDIFATNVIAKDPYTGRQVLLIDSRGCPVDMFVFPELHKTPDGALEAEFYAFKIPDSNFLVFQATVKTCKGPCEPVICSDKSRGSGSLPSWGRRKRSISGISQRSRSRDHNLNGTNKAEEEEVHEMLRVYLSHDDVPEAIQLEQHQTENPSQSPIMSSQKVCLDKLPYYTLVALSALFILLFIVILPYFVMVRIARSSLKVSNQVSLNCIIIFKYKPLIDRAKRDNLVNGQLVGSRNAMCHYRHLTHHNSRQH
ncbi:hypothetical protein RDWZM_003420 [Blomia tropicalis]|uniref:Uncharacterized protein n=1 Tax=Blomia tropicalis TaxID=40697 RepID=A0A9Q0RSN4_BLOTA|nr:hypothetical protein RDWZM_003420 [Blomia tropicalis]